VGQEVQTPPCLVQNEQVHARAGTSEGSGCQSSAKEMVPQWHDPWMSMAVDPETLDATAARTCAATRTCILRCDPTAAPRSVAARQLHAAWPKKSPSYSSRSRTSAIGPSSGVGEHQVLGRPVRTAGYGQCDRNLESRQSRFRRILNFLPRPLPRRAEIPSITSRLGNPINGSILWSHLASTSLRLMAVFSRGLEVYRLAFSNRLTWR
jgi:hypothetical protein